MLSATTFTHEVTKFAAEQALLSVQAKSLCNLQAIVCKIVSAKSQNGTTGRLSDFDCRQTYTHLRLPGPLAAPNKTSLLYLLTAGLYR